MRWLLFVFEDILKLDDRAIQMVLREVDSKDLGLAMRGASADVQEKILDNMSQRGAEMLREEMEYMPPQRRRVVEEAQTKIVARRAQARGRRRARDLARRQRRGRAHWLTSSSSRRLEPPQYLVADAGSAEERLAALAGRG